MSSLIEKEVKRKFRHLRIRKKISGTSDQPRLCVHRSNKNISVQIINDGEKKILLGMSTLSKSLKGKIKNGGNIDAATLLGEVVAQQATKSGIKKVCFDRGGYLFHGRIKAFADAARKGGLEF